MAKSSAENTRNGYNLTGVSMKKMLVVFLLLVAFVAPARGDVLEFVLDTLGRVVPVGYNTQLPVGEDAAFGFVDLATTTLTFSPDVATSFGILPVGVRKLYVTAYNGALYIGHGNDLATGTLANGILIASGTQGYISGFLATTTPRVWGMPSGAATVTLRLMGWGNE